MATGFFQNLNPFNSQQRPPQQQANSQQQQQINQQASQQQQTGPANSQFQNPNGTPPGTSGNPAQQSQNPLDEFNEVLGFNRQQQQNQQGLQGTQQQPQGQQQQQQQSPQYDGYTQPFDLASARQRMSNVKFSAQLPDDIRQRITSGDTSAFFDALDHVARESFLHSTQMAHQFVDRGVKTGLDRFGSGLDERFRDYQIRNQNPENDVLNHPSVAPMFGAMKQMIAQQNPNMAPNQVAEMATKWFNQLSSAMSTTGKGGEQDQTQNRSQAPDWAAEFGIADEQQSQQQQFQPQGNFVPRGF